MILGLKPVELVWLFVALAIVAQQLIVREGVFDPSALAAIVFFVGLIPAGRADKNGGGNGTLMSSLIAPVLRKILKDNPPPPEDPEDPK